MGRLYFVVIIRHGLNGHFLSHHGKVGVMKAG